jgi:arsenite methyltransferase
MMNKGKTKTIVRESYGKIARGHGGCGCAPCGTDTEDLAKTMGYSDEELSKIPKEANLGLGCGNPTAIASLKEGETVLDLGSGAGFDCFLAVAKVGPAGRVIGVDMTPEMIDKARENADRAGIKNVEFRLGEIENLPLADSTVDVAISNCVINLSADKPKVFREIYRALKPGGRISIADIALTKELPEKIRKSIEAYVGCVGGAVLIDEYSKIVKASGLKDVKVTIQATSSCIDADTEDPIGRAILEGAEDIESVLQGIVSVIVEAHK